MKRVPLGVFWGVTVVLIGVARWGFMTPSEPVSTTRYFGNGVTPMDHDMSDTFVRPVFVNGSGIGAAGRGGGTSLGALSLPAPWHPGLTVRVKWRRCDRFDRNNPVPDSEACRWTEKDVLVHPYSSTAGAWLHILENDEVLIIPTMLGPRHQHYPGPNYPKKNFRKRKESPND